MSKKITVGVLFGGKSAEHEVSLISAKNIIEGIDKKKYQVVLIGVDKQGRWHLNDKSQFLLNSDNPKRVKLNKANKPIALAPSSNGQLANLFGSKLLPKVDVIFPVIHGPFGEDGTVQGLLKLANTAFVGVSVLGSAMGMDKDVAKRLATEAKIPNAAFIAFHSNQKVNFAPVKKKLGLPLFIKPANLGSSVGIKKVSNKKDFDQAVKEAFQFDTKIIIEEFIKGREIECAILGNEDPKASVLGEIIPHHDFYSYEAKYIDEAGARLEIPAKVKPQIARKIQKMAIEIFKLLECSGFSRVDFFLTKDNKIYFNEINTIPGFTSISMYPKLWQASGVPYTKLIDKLIQLAIQKFKQEQKLKTTYS